MADHKILVTGEKESFLIRVFIKKLQDADMKCEFVNWTVDAINSKWEGTVLVVLYINENEKPSDKVLHFLTDRMSEHETLMIPIGEHKDVDDICEKFPSDLIYKKFIRPIDNDEFVSSVREMLDKVEAGEFKKSILIVDDDPNYLGLTREWLRGTYKVAMANSGLQAIKWLGKNKVDLILLDYEMPVTDGPQVLEMLRADEETRSIPVMFLTGKSDKESVMAVLALKPEGYFLKTIEKEELLKNLADYFTLHK